MSFLNFTMSRVAYDDESACSDPLNKAFDVSTAKVGLHVQFPSVTCKVVDPGQVLLLESTSRALTYDGTTQFELSHPDLGSDVVRMRWTGTGTAPAFRALRDLGGSATTTLELSRASSTAAKLRVTAGTPWTTGVVQIGDEVFIQPTVDGEFESPFSVAIQGSRFPVVDLGADYLVVRDNGAISGESGIVLGADFATALRVFSSAGVKVGDKVKFAPTANLRPDNKNYTLDVTNVTDRDLYFINPYGIDEVAIPGSNSFVVFERLLSFLAIQSSGPLSLRFDSPSASDLALAEYEAGRTIFMGTVAATSVYAVNDGTNAVNVTVHSCSF
jgi:hypothetical protein